MEAFPSAYEPCWRLSGQKGTANLDRQAYNEDRYEVLRSVAENGTYVSIKSLVRNTASFIDSAYKETKRITTRCMR
jgi:hypothetical protein